MPDPKDPVAFEREEVTIEGDRTLYAYRFTEVNDEEEEPETRD